MPHYGYRTRAPVHGYMHGTTARQRGRQSANVLQGHGVRKPAPVCTIYSAQPAPALRGYVTILTLTLGSVSGRCAVHVRTCKIIESQSSKFLTSPYIGE